MAYYRHSKHCQISFGQKVADVATRVGQGVAVAKGVYEAGKTVYGVAQAAAPYLSPLLAAL